MGTYHSRLEGGIGSMKFRESQLMPRLPKEVTVEYEPLTYPFNGTSDNPTVTSSRDISLKGAGFYSLAPVELQTLLTVRLGLKGFRRKSRSKAAIFDPSIVTAPLTVIAEVARCEQLANGSGYIVGVMFVNMDSDDAQALEEYLDTLADRISGESAA